MAVQDPWNTPSARADVLEHGPIGAQSETAAFMAKIYRWMALGLGITGLVSLYVSTQPAIVLGLVRTPFLLFALWIGAAVMSWTLPSVARRSSFGVVASMFVAYAALLGLMLAPLFLVYTHESIASTFFVTAGGFGAMSAYGTITKKDLSAWGGFLMMGFFGILIAGVVNMFVRSDALSFIIGCAGVLVFAGLAAWHTQKLRSLAAMRDDRMAITGALILYLDFINLFLSLLRLFGRRR